MKHGDLSGHPPEALTHEKPPRIIIRNGLGT